MPSCNPQRPQRMWQGDRLADPHFEFDELLYRRVGSKHVKDGRIFPPTLRQPSFSVNRSKGSEPGDVLFPSCGAPPGSIKPGDGVAAFSVGDAVHPEQIDPEAPGYSAQVVHLPCDDNYFHSEVQMLFRGEFRSRFRSRAAAIAKRSLRLRICEQSIVVLEPDRVA